jgi:hypothetical protein
MKPKIEKTSFGKITVGDETYKHDIVIRLDRQVHKRRKKLSKKIYGTSHTISLAEAQDVYEPGAKRLIVGTGQLGLVGLSDEASAFFEAQGCDVILRPTPEALEIWNKSKGKGKTVGLFHVTC